MLTDESSRIDLPARPADQRDAPVAGWRSPVPIDTYLPEPPDRYPAYLDRRVYQGSSGRIYPLPFFERIAAEKVPVSTDAVHLENEWIRLMILPGLGGRIHLGFDRISGHDFFYRNEVIKPALIGLTGPWIAGGVEFNWPQHHRPATYLPTDVSIERGQDGSVTVWCSDHDPQLRMKGMHGICLHPDRALIELKVRLFNRTEEPQSFLWWANVAARADADFQSFFPTDVTMVADHAKRAVTAFPHADRPYYGIDYPHRQPSVEPSAAVTNVPGDRIDWYRTIPVPTSYMCLDSDEDFFGGYDHSADAGFVHVADHQISVGKKQWTWGSAAFGEAWCRNLTDDGSAYVELMAGVFTDNQPDFSFIAPGETKVFSQFWYPIQQIGPAHAATVEAALSVTELSDRRLRIGVSATAARPGAVLEVRAGDWQELIEVELAPGRPALREVELPEGAGRDDLEISVRVREVELVGWRTREAKMSSTPATEPALPAEVVSVEELYLIGIHLQQYRHATRSPVPYWREALRRDPGHAPTCTALAIRHYRAGQYVEAEKLLRTAIGRLTALNPNPADTTAHYYLGLVLRRRGDHAGAYDAFGKALWNREWRPAAGYQLARLDALAARDVAALDRLDDVLRTEPEQLQALALRVIILRRLGRPDAALQTLDKAQRLDPLHWSTRDLAGEPLDCDAQTGVDVALEYAGVGEIDAALRVLEVAWNAETNPAAGAAAVRPLVAYYRARLLDQLGRTDEAAEAEALARGCSDRYCFPGRLDDADLLADRLESDPDDHRAAALFGHWLYAQGRAEDAIAAWRTAVKINPADAVSWRNLGLGTFNQHGDVTLALECYDLALIAAPNDARLRFERDQLDQRAGVSPTQRMRRFQDHLELVLGRDDTTVELAHLHLTLGQPDQAIEVLQGRRFQPWEGGEGQVLRAWDRACLAQSRRVVSESPLAAVEWIDRALDPPQSLGEQRHPLANSALLHLVRGDALDAAGDQEGARVSWSEAADQVGDFLSMSTTPFSEATYASILAHRRLGDEAAAAKLVEGLAAYCDELAETPAVVDYFATSLPTLLLFTEDPAVVQDRRLAYIRAQLGLLRGDRAGAEERLKMILDSDPNFVDAIDLLGSSTGSESER